MRESEIWKKIENDHLHISVDDITTDKGIQTDFCPKLPSGRHPYDSIRVKPKWMMMMEKEEEIVGPRKRAMDEFLDPFDIFEWFEAEDELVKLSCCMCNFPIIPHVCLLVGWMVDWSVGRSVCPSNFQKGAKLHDTIGALVSSCVSTATIWGWIIEMI